MGVSMLSLVEIFYYVSLRFACNLNFKRMKKMKALKNNTIADSLPGIHIDFTNHDFEKKD
jgi:hypothetical protein